jgi:hypothetical protein
VRTIRYASLLSLALLAGCGAQSTRHAATVGATGATGATGASGAHAAAVRPLVAAANPLRQAPRTAVAAGVVGNVAEVPGKQGSTPDALPAASSSGPAPRVAAGAPSDAEIRKEIAQARKAGVVLPSGTTAQSFNQSPTYPTISGGNWAFPIQPLSVSLGPDIATSGRGCGRAAVEVAITAWTIVAEGISGFGPYAPILRIDGGPYAGWFVYYGHAAPDVVAVGAHVRAGQPIAEIGCGVVGISSGPHLEIGMSPPGGATCCPAFGETAPAVGALMQQLYSRSPH